jgi:hypothetical protein
VTTSQYIAAIQRQSDKIAELKELIDLTGLQYDASRTAFMSQEAMLRNRIAELRERLIAPTDSGVLELDDICNKFNSNKKSNLHDLTCSIWNKAHFEALKEQVKL